MSQSADWSKLNHWIEDISAAMVTFLGPNSQMQCRPMLVQQITQHGEIWVTTPKPLGPVEFIHKNPTVVATFVDRTAERFVSVQGVSRLVGTVETIEPNLVVLAIEVQQAESWDTPHAEVVHRLHRA